MSLSPTPQPLERASDAQLERERLTSLINSMADGVIATNELGRVVTYNAAALSILDRNTSMQGLSLEKVLPILDINNEPVDVSSLIHGTKIVTVSRDYRLRYESDGSIINLYLSISPVRLGYGKDGHNGFVLVLRDITREKSLEEERDEFISVASHELRTPMAIAEGNISNAQFVVNRGGDLVQVKAALEAAHQQIIFLTGLINDLSTLSRAEGGRLAVEVEPINAHDLVMELVNDYKGQAQSKNLELKSDLDPKLELLYSSKLYVKEVLQNFITNSIKYTLQGSVTIGAHPQDDGILFAISDTGIGISKSDQEKIFNKFFRSEDYRTRQNSGTGLGLYVTAKLAKLLNADIKVSSQLNQGSVFSIYIPNIQKH